MKKNEAGVAELDYAGDLKSPSFVGSNPIARTRDAKAFLIVTALNILIAEQFGWFFIKHCGFLGLIAAWFVFDAVREIGNDAKHIYWREFGD